jgi:YHS domain-containing protein
MRIETLIYFLLWAALLVAMLRFGCGAHAMGHGHRRHRRGGEENLRWIAPDKDVDPVCGMTVAPASAKSSMHDGRVYYFCSSECRDKFETAPQAYAKTAHIPSKSEETDHGSHHAA